MSVLEERLAEARSTWPGLERHDATFRALVATIEDPLAVRIADLYLAHACLAHDPAAIEAFVRALFPRLDRQLARVRTPPALAEDVKSELRERLFFGRTADDPPLLAGYSGRGELASWLRSIGLRMAARVKERAGRNVAIEGVDAPAARQEPELELLRRTYAPRLESAMVAALDAASGRDRELLRQHYLDGLSLEGVAELHGVHRATAARWLADARAAIMKKVEQGLRAEVTLTDSELESLLQAVAGDIAPSLTRILAR